MQDRRSVRLHDVQLAWSPTDHDAAALRRAAALRLRLPAAALQRLAVVRRALDVRQRRLRHSLVLDVELAPRVAAQVLRSGRASATPAQRHERLVCRARPPGPRPVVVGAGPAGLFAALTLAEAGWPPLILERGDAVETRSRAVSRLYAHGILRRESNVCYGEGGAGTFSDGKLYTRVGDARVERVMRHLVAHGAPAHICIDHRPHLGTDRLVVLLRAVRARLLALGCELRFGCGIDDVVLEGGEVRGLRLHGGEVVDATRMVLATGHSAREIWERLAAHGLPLEARPFAVGFRVEHPQALIDGARYGHGADPRLPAADYRVTYNETAGAARRGVYSFCMCPGGVVVTTPTEPDALCINGMSHAARKGRFANSALVVSVGAQDFAAAGHHGLFAGVDFQRQVERAAYAQGGGAFVAPASRLADFAAGRPSRDVGPTSYRRGLCPGDLQALYPAPITDALRRALPAFERTLRGFITQEATLIGVETRTASPIRVPRGEDLQALGARGLYPAGEGMGYGGGIVSAAVDGIRVAEAMLQKDGADTVPAHPS